MATVFQLIAIFSQSAALLGPWWCLGAMRIVPSPHSGELHSARTLQWTRTPRTGSCTAWVWQEWNPCRVTPLTGEQHAVTQPTVLIFEITRGNFKDFDIIKYTGGGQCKKVEFVSIRNHKGMHQTAQFWQKNGVWGLHIDSTGRGCQFAPSSGAVVSEDNFGHYESFNPKFRCSKDDQSTTQWWFGGHLWGARP